ncbi:MAG: hypothetical protein Kow0077_22410 [Anaerolineae bacterium]
MAKKRSKKGRPKGPDGAAISKQKQETRLALVKQFIESVIFNQYRQLVSWQSVTGQSSQIDSGYLGQQLVSLLTGIPGSGTRGKGLDLADGSEVKAASTLSGVDVPRWNNQLSTSQKVREYLDQPAIYFVLFDTLNKRESFPLRVRIWKVEPRKDECFSRVVNKWASERSSGNFQLHPPCWRNDNVATNNAGNIELPLLLHAQQIEIGDIDYMEIQYYKESPGKCRMVPGQAE